MKTKPPARMLALLLALVLVLSACGSPASEATGSPDADGSQPPSQSAAVPTPVPSLSPSPASSPSPSAGEAGLGLLQPVKEYTDSTYTDIGTDADCYEAVKAAYEYGLLRERSELFEPDEPLINGEFLSLLARIHAGYTTGEIVFEEGNGERWDTCYRDYCKETGIYRNPLNSQNVSICWNAFAIGLAGVMPEEAYTPINDIPEGSILGAESDDEWHDAVYLLYRAGILPLTEDTVFYPERNVTRAEAVEAVSRLIDLTRRESRSLEALPVVSYLLEDSSLYQEQKVTRGELASEPKAPSKQGYAFAGWFTAPEGGEPFNFSTPVMDSITLYAHWEGSGRYPEGYSITGMSWDSSAQTMTVSYFAASDAQLVVTAYSSDRSSTLKRSDGSAPATEPEQTEPGQAAVVLGDLPEHFLATARLISAGNYVCDAYLFMDETEEYQTFLGKTAADYAAEGAEVLNLDEQQVTNFLVLGDDTVLLPQDGSLRLTSYDPDTGLYVFDGNTDSLAQYGPGDHLVYTSSTETYAIAVEEIRREGSSTVVQEAEGAGMGDFFSAVKIDTVGDGTVGASAVPLGSIPDIDKEYNGEKSFSKTFTNVEEGKDKTVQYNVTVSGGAKLHFLMYYDLKLFGADYLKVETLVTLDAAFDSTLDLNAGSSKGNYNMKYLHLVDLTFPIPMTWNILEVSANLDFGYRWEVDGHADFKYTYHKEFGFEYVQVAGEGSFQTTNTQKSTKDMHANAHFNAEVGLEGDFSLNVLGDLLQLKIPAYVGLELDATAQGTVMDAANGIHHTEDSYHACALCLDGDLYLNTDITFEATYNILDNWKGTIGEKKNLLKDHKHLTDLYLSILNDKDSIHGGSPAFGLGKCPNYIYKVTVLARNADNEDVSVDVTISKTRNVMGDILGTSSGSTSGDVIVLMGTTPYTGYLYPARYSTGNYQGYRAFAVIDDAEASAAFVITDQAKQIVLVGKAVEESEPPEESESPEASENPEDPQGGQQPDVPTQGPADAPVVLQDPNNPDSTINLDIPQVPRGTAVKGTGTCGDSAYWTLFDNYVLVIAGSGSIKRDKWAFYGGSPQQLVILDGITEIGDETFFFDSFSNGIILPNTITKIGKSAFEYCSVTGDLSLPDSVVEIGDHAFSNCSNITRVALGSGVQKLGHYAFHNCTGLTSVDLGSNLKEIGACAFDFCSSLTGDLVIPDSVEVIGDHAFTFCPALNGRLFLGSHLKQIGNDAFSSAFTGDLIIPDSVESIGTGAFIGFSGTGVLQIGNGVKEIGERAFAGTKFTKLILGSCSETIGNGAFQNCDALEGTLFIPESVKAIGDNAFRGCSGFTGTLWIGDGVEEIGKNAFEDCTGLTQAVFRSSVQEIGRNAFLECSSLAEAFFYGDAPDCPGGNPFGQCPVTVYYLEGKAGWTNPWKNNETATFTP